jgi:hypothetical protein
MLDDSATVVADRRSPGYWRLSCALALGLAACGCDSPQEVGSPFGHQGTATITGTATIASRPGDGLHLQFLLVDGGLGIGVLPDNLFDQASTCGDTIEFEIQDVEAGTYTLALHLRDPDIDPVDDADLVYDQTAPEVITVADGQQVVATLTFP